MHFNKKKLHIAIITLMSLPALCMEAPPRAKGKPEAPLWDVASMLSPSALQSRQQTLEIHLKVLETLKEMSVFPHDVIDGEVGKTKLLIAYCIDRIKAHLKKDQDDMFGLKNISSDVDDEDTFGLGDTITAVDILINDVDFWKSFEKREKQLKFFLQAKQVKQAPGAQSAKDTKPRSGSITARSKQPLSDPVPRPQEPMVPAPQSRGILGLVWHPFASSESALQKVPQTLPAEPIPAGGSPRFATRAGSHIVRPSAPLNPGIQKEKSKEA